MRVLIRQRTSSKFLADRAVWVRKREKALDFVSSVMAHDVATRMDLKNIEIVLDFGKCSSEIVLPVIDMQRAPRVPIPQRD